MQSVSSKFKILIISLIFHIENDYIIIDNIRLRNDNSYKNF